MSLISFGSFGSLSIILMLSASCASTSNTSNTSNTNNNKTSSQQGDYLGSVSTPVNTPEKQRVVALLKSIETWDESALQGVGPTYTQHNLHAADGIAGFQSFVHSMPQGTIRVQTVRVFQDGDFVFSHNSYTSPSMSNAGANAGAMDVLVGFDVFRTENGKIVEHWDNLQPQLDPNPSGHTLIDGSTALTDLDKTEANKALVRSLVDEVLVGGHFEKLPTYYNGDQYIQHNPRVGDGVSTVQKAFAAWAAQGIKASYTKVHHVLGEGNFVLVMSEGNFNGQSTAIYDMFRVENGKIAEHWDILENIPPNAEWKNANGKF